MSSFDKISKIWCGPSEPISFGPNQSVGEMLLNKFSAKPDNVAQIHDDAGTTLTYKEMRELSIRAAQNLYKLGLERGDVVGFVCKNSQHLVPVVIGCFLNGFPINPMDPTFDEGEIFHLFKTNDPKVVFCDFDCVEVTQKALKMMNSDAEIITMIQKVNNLRFSGEILVTSGTEELYVAPDLGDNKQVIAAILSSSGTTGLPKGVIITHAQCLFLGSSNLWDKDENAIFLHFSSFYWIAGLACTMYALLNLQAYVLTTKVYTPESLLYLVKKHKVNRMFANVMHTMRLLSSGLLKHNDLSNIKQYLTGGNAMSTEAINELNRYLPERALNVGYGMTEVFYIVSKNDGHADWKSVGVLAVNVQIKIEDDDGNVLNPNERGNILIKLAIPVLCYYKNREATENALQNGWLKTGDIGYFNDEGHLFVVDRKKDIIRYCYNHIFPTELEQVIQSLESVQEVCVVAIKELVSYELPAAVVVKKAGSNLSEQEVFDIVAEKLTDFKKLRGGVFFVDDLPKTVTGKVLRRVVQETAENLYSEKKNKY